MKKNDEIKSKEIESDINPQEQKSSFIKEWIIPILCAVGIAIALNKFVIMNVYIPSGSMIPTLNIKDRLIVTRLWNKDNIKRGDILVFYSDELQETLIKRVIGLPGDHIVIKDGVVNVNEDDLEEDYVKNNDYSNEELVYDVPEGKYFFLGDNRPVSKDSRRWINPYIDEDDIKGKAILKFYPISDFGSID